MLKLPSYQFVRYVTIDIKKKKKKEMGILEATREYVS